MELQPFAGTRMGESQETGVEFELARAGAGAVKPVSKDWNSQSVL